ncbi:hypothetical protein [Halorientalis halophila]|uniref:hypothetical protein n=1 Tax=Halorientalis halophila TaxID=3108499 RepID=UPI0030099C26
MLRDKIEREIGDETVDVILYRENGGTLSDPDERWREFSSLAAVPERALDGWEELIVYTSQHIYQWVPTGYDNGPTSVPRYPETASSDTAATERDVRRGRS